MNAKMAELKKAFELAGFTAVKTVLSSGNVVFDSRPAKEGLLERKAEAAMQETLGRSFYTIVRPVTDLQCVLDSDPYEGWDLPVGAKRVVSFLREAAKPRVDLPLREAGAEVLTLSGREVFTVYVPGDQGPVFMNLIEKAFGKGVTTRTWDTIVKCVRA